MSQENNNMTAEIIDLDEDDPKTVSRNVASATNDNAQKIERSSAAGADRGNSGSSKMDKQGPSTTSQTPVTRLRSGAQITDYGKKEYPAKFVLDTQRMASKFMENFDPETSARERRKLNRKLNNSGRKYQNVIYDENGLHIKSGKDMCDCLNLQCPGCFFPCPKCRSTKCGGECRVLRKFSYDFIDFEGSEQIIKNPYSIPK